MLHFCHYSLVQVVACKFCLHASSKCLVDYCCFKCLDLLTIINMYVFLCIRFMRSGNYTRLDCVVLSSLISLAC